MKHEPQFLTKEQLIEQIDEGQLIDDGDHYGIVDEEYEKFEDLIHYFEERDQDDLVEKLINTISIWDFVEEGNYEVTWTEHVSVPKFNGDATYARID